MSNQTSGGPLHCVVRRIPIGRLCNLRPWDESWPKGAICIVEGHHDMDTNNEYAELRVLAAFDKSKIGDIIKIYRSTINLGVLRVWRKDLLDPEFMQPNTVFSPHASSENLPRQDA